MTAFDVTGKRVTVAGAARSGIAAARLLVARGAHVTLSDRRTDVPEAEPLRRIGVTLELGGHLVDTFASADLVVLSPGVPLDQDAVRAARERGVPVVGELDLAFRWLQGRVIAITGTKGKSTTTTLTGRILQAAGFSVAVGGNIGQPLSAQVDASTPDTLHVVEASSFQLELTEAFHPWIAVMLNLSPDHLDRHAGFEAYLAAKARIFRNQDTDDWVVVNADDPAVLDLSSRGRARKRLVSSAAIPEGVCVEGDWIVERRPESTARLVPLSAIHLQGPHLLEDVLAAAAVGAIVGAGSEAITAAVGGFYGLEHAMEFVATFDGVTFVNDSKATNVEAARRSIESFDQGGLIAILGGRFKGGDLGLLRDALRTRARAVVAIGEARPLVRAALSGAVDVYEAESLEAAVDDAFLRAKPRGVVLLAPACASFDMFQDYAERGRRFKEEVARLARASEY
jgi:UDP-N-acetylmuramoylalanine--D-glutamate ligase